MFSRLILACQYGMVLFHTRHHRRTRMALTIAIWLHLLPALAYLIAGLAVKAHPDNHITLIWYIVGLMEMLSLIIHAMFSKTLSFEGTHFNERLNLLTLIILGEGMPVS